MTGPMNNARTSPTATLLGNPNLPNYGKVLIVGGNTSSGDLKAELYDPVSGTFSNTGSTTTLRTGHTATLLNDGTVLIAGGTGDAASTAEVYDPRYGTFTLTAGGMEPRAGHTATLLSSEDGNQDGSVLFIGTDGSNDLYHTGTFASVGGPFSAGFMSVRTAALFAPESDGFTTTGTLHTPRDRHTATVPQDGTVLVVGGTHRYLTFVDFDLCQFHAVVLPSAELFR